MSKIKTQLLIAYIGENIAGGFYLKLAEINAQEPKLVERFKVTAGDEIRHGEYFNLAHEEVFGSRLKYRKQLLWFGRVLGFIGKVISREKLLRVIVKGEHTAVVALEKELASQKESGSPSNPYLEVVERILPDERAHAEPYHGWI